LILQTSKIKDNADINDIKKYLNKLTDELKLVLMNLDGENLEANYKKKIEDTEIKAIKNEENAKEIIRSIINRADKITKSYEKYVGETSDALIASVNEKYIAKTDREELISDTLARVDLSAESLNAVFEKKYSVNFEDLVNEISGLTDFETLYKTYIRLSAEGIRIGKEGSPFEALFSNDSLSFLQNGVKVAYITNKKLYITDANVTNELVLGLEDGTPLYTLKASLNGLTLTKGG